MTRGLMPVLGCDGDDGGCDEWTVDYYETAASSVDGERITRERRAPGWWSSPDADLCPDHAPATNAPAIEPPVEHAR